MSDHLLYYLTRGKITTASVPRPPVPATPTALPPKAAPAPAPPVAGSMKSGSSGGTSLPDAPATPEPEVKPKPKAKTKANANKRQKVEPSTPLEKGTDLAEKLLAKVTRTSTLETQLIVCPFAEKLLDEIRADLATFRCCGRIRDRFRPGPTPPSRCE